MDVEVRKIGVATIEVPWGGLVRSTRRRLEVKCEEGIQG